MIEIIRKKIGLIIFKDDRFKRLEKIIRVKSVY